TVVVPRQAAEELNALGRKTGKRGSHENASLYNKVMPSTEEAHARLAGIPDLTVSADAPLAPHTRFGIGGPADLYAETSSAEAFIAALTAARESVRPTVVIGGGTNLIVSDQGFRGIVLRHRADRLMAANQGIVAD